MACLRSYMPISISSTACPGVSAFFQAGCAALRSGATVLRLPVIPARTDIIVDFNANIVV